MAGNTTLTLIEQMESGQVLTRAGAEAVMEELLCGRMETTEIVRLLLALNARPVLVEELAGFATVTRRQAAEVFADRAYEVDGTLVSRRKPGALITDPAKAAAQAVRMASEGKVRTIDGVDIDVSVQTICCHGDTPGAERIVRAVREGLEAARLQVRPLHAWLP